MTAFKKFSDFLAAFGLFWLCVFLFRKFMPYKPTGIDSAVQRLKHFFSADNYINYKPYILLIGLLALSLVLCRIFASFPPVTLAVSALPFIQAVSMYLNGQLYEWAAFYMVLLVFPIIGSAADAAILDRTDGKRRLFHAANIAGLMAPAYLAYVFVRHGKIYGMLLSDVEKSGKFDLLIAQNYQSITPRILISIAFFFILAVLLAYAWRDIYFLDAAISLAPLIYFFIKMLRGELIFHPAFIMTISFIFFGTRLAVMLSEPPLKREQTIQT